MLDGVLSPIAELDHFVQEIIIISILNVACHSLEHLIEVVFYSHHPNGGPWDLGGRHEKRRLWLLVEALLLRLR